MALPTLEQAGYSCRLWGRMLRISGIRIPREFRDAGLGPKYWNFTRVEEPLLGGPYDKIVQQWGTLTTEEKRIVTLQL